MDWRKRWGEQQTAQVLTDERKRLRMHESCHPYAHLCVRTDNSVDCQFKACGCGAGAVQPQQVTRCTLGERLENTHAVGDRLHRRATHLNVLDCICNPATLHGPDPAEKQHNNRTQQTSQNHSTERTVYRATCESSVFSHDSGSVLPPKRSAFACCSQD